jgi:hypothetical protein
MNIFYLDTDPKKAANMLCDKHIIKMIIESAQLLGNAHHYYKTEIVDNIYKETHNNHPCSKWVRKYDGNYNWLFEHFVSLLEEYSNRYDKVHKSSYLIDYLFYNPCLEEGFVEPPLCMPERYKWYNEETDIDYTNNITGFRINKTAYYNLLDCDHIISRTMESYRDYYNGEKSRFAKWKLGNVPDWYII